MVRFGMIGLGAFGRLHAQAIEASGRARLVAAAVATEASAARIRDELGIECGTDVDGLLARDDVDAVIVASPNRFHRDHACRALDAGKHVLLEKPMGLSLEECDAIIAAARRAGTVVAIGHELRLFTFIERMKALVDGGAIGRPLYGEIALWRRPYRLGASNWRRDPAMMGSSVLEEPIHYLDLAVWFFQAVGLPVRLSAWSNSRSPETEFLRENLMVQLEFGGGQHVAVSRVISARGHRLDIRLAGDGGAAMAFWEGTMDRDTAPRVGLRVSEEDGWREVEVPRETGHAFDLVRQIDAFVDAVEGRRPPAVGVDDGRRAVALSLLVEEALRRGEAVPVSDL